MNRRDFITLLGGAAAWPLAARAQQPTLPVVGFVNAGAEEASADRVRAFRKGLSEAGYVEGRNVTVEYHWLEGQFDRLPALMADLVRSRAAVIATPATPPAAIAAKAATATIPIVFGVSEDPVKLGLVPSLARPGGNVTGVNSLAQEVNAKRLALLHELVPKAVRVAVLVNPANATNAETTLRDVHDAARAIGLEIQVLNASTSREIEAAFAALARAPRCPVRRWRRILRQPPCAVCHLGGERADSGYLWGSRPSHSGRADELRNQHHGQFSSSRRLYRHHPQGHQARRPARGAGDQVRVRH